VTETLDAPPAQLRGRTQRIAATWHHAKTAASRIQHTAAELVAAAAAGRRHVVYCYEHVNRISIPKRAQAPSNSRAASARPRAIP
jgi:hypothetical protein